MGETKIRVLIVDDEPLARKFIRRLLDEEEGVEVAGECGSGREAVEAVREQAPDRRRRARRPTPWTRRP